MTQAIDTLASVAAGYDAVVFDQWGVLHNGDMPYPHAVECISGLFRKGIPLSVLSNSGKRARPNAERIQALGFDAARFDNVMTSGEALWSDISGGKVKASRLFAIERASGDARSWAAGLDVDLTDDLSSAEAVLLMGLPDGTCLADWQHMLDDMLRWRLSVFCTNPDRASPRGHGLVVSPGALAFAYEGMGGTVRFYGKPHAPVFDTLKTVIDGDRILMVGDSLEHDIAGAHDAGWDSLLIQGGLYAREFASGDANETLAAIAAEKSVALPTYRMDLLQ